MFFEADYLARRVQYQALFRDLDPHHQDEDDVELPGDCHVVDVGFPVNLDLLYT